MIRAVQQHLRPLVREADLIVTEIHGQTHAGGSEERASEAVERLRDIARRMQAVLRLPAEATAAVAQVERGFAGLVAMREAAARAGIAIAIEPARDPCRLCGDRGGDTVTPADPCPMCGKERGA